MGEHDARAFDVDERDSTWEDDGARYRVYLFGPGHGVAQDAATGRWDVPAGWDVRTVDLVGVEVVDAIAFAEREASPGARYAVALVHRDESGRRGLVWLVGMDLNDPPDLAWEHERQRRMHARAELASRLPGVIDDAE